MFVKRKRPWKRDAKITRKERNDGTIWFETFSSAYYLKAQSIDGQTFTTLAAAEAAVDAWWAEVEPRLIKSERRV